MGKVKEWGMVEQDREEELRNQLEDDLDSDEFTLISDLDPDEFELTDDFDYESYELDVDFDHENYELEDTPDLNEYQTSNDWTKPSPAAMYSWMVKLEELRNKNTKKTTSKKTKWSDKVFRSMLHIQFEAMFSTKKKQTVIASPPGSIIRRFTRNVYSKKHFDRVVEPVFEDWWEEHYQALDNDAGWLQHTSIRLRNMCYLAKAMGVLGAATFCWGIIKKCRPTNS